MKRHLFTTLVIAVSAFGLLQSDAIAVDAKNILMIAGKPSHGPGQLEHNAGVQLLAKCLKESGLPLDVKFTLGGAWPTAEEMAKADTILIYSDGGGGHQAGRLPARRS